MLTSRFSRSRLMSVLVSMAIACVPLYLRAEVPASQPIVYKLEIRDTIQPVTAGRLDRALSIANRDNAEALLIELDTPGGLLDSTRHMVGAIMSSHVPVIV